MGDIKRSIEEGEKFKAITLMGSSFLYLPTHEAHEKALKDYCDVLEDGGKLVLQWYEKDPERVQVWTNNVEDWKKEQGLEWERIKPEDQQVDPTDPNRRILSKLKDTTVGDTSYVTRHVNMPDSEFVPYPDILDEKNEPMKIGKSSFARGYIHKDGHYEEPRDMTTTTNYMLKSKFPVLEKMLKLAGFKTVKLVPGPDEPDVFFSERGQRKLYAIVAEK